MKFNLFISIPLVESLIMSLIQKKDYVLVV